MFFADITFPFGANWFDLVVAVALVYGLWSGMRAGLSGALLELIGWVLMVAAALAWYLPFGHWLAQRLNRPEETANLAAFLSIAVTVFLLVQLVRLTLQHPMRKVRFAAIIENFGGALAGVVRMAALFAWLAVMLCLVRSDFWHEEIGIQSRFGSYVIGHCPAVAVMLHKHYPEKFLPFQKLKRRKDPGVEEIPAETK